MDGKSLVQFLAQRQNTLEYQKEHWEGSFEDYLEVVRTHPLVTRTAFQRVYDMVLSYGIEEVQVGKEKVTRYKFFDDPEDEGRDAIFGLEKTLANLVNVLKSAAHRYGSERRVLLLHGPVGSSKSTIVRLFKKGIERYSRKDEGALYSFGWLEEENAGRIYHPCPMHEEPLHLVPIELRTGLVERLNAGRGLYEFRVGIEGDLCPFCRRTTTPG